MESPDANGWCDEATSGELRPICDQGYHGYHVGDQCWWSVHCGHGGRSVEVDEHQGMIIRQVGSKGVFENPVSLTRAFVGWQMAPGGPQIVWIKLVQTARLCYFGKYAA